MNRSVNETIDQAWICRAKFVIQCIINSWWWFWQRTRNFKNYLYLFGEQKTLYKFKFDQIALINEIDLINFIFPFCWLIFFLITIKWLEKKYYVPFSHIHHLHHAFLVTDCKLHTDFLSMRESTSMINKPRAYQLSVIFLSQNILLVFNM